MRLTPFFKLFFGYSFLALIAALLLYVYLQVSLKENINTRLNERLLAEVRLVQTYFDTFPSLDRSIPAMDAVADRLAERLAVRLTIVASDGRVLGDSAVPAPDVTHMENHRDRPEIRMALMGETGLDIRHSQTLNEELLYVAAPLLSNGVITGAVRVASPIRSLNWIDDEAGRAALWTVFLGLLTALALSLVTHRMSVAPIARITASIRRWNDGKAPSPPDAAEPSEWHSFSLAFQEMITQSEDKLKRLTGEKAQLEAVLFAMAEGVMVTDAGGRIIHFNPAFTRLMGADTWCLNKRPIEVFRNAELQAAVDATLDTVTPGEPVTGVNLTLTRYDRTFQVNLTTVRTEHTYHGAVAVFHDVTELRRLEQVRRDFVANVSHELRTPLTSIKGYTETLLDGAVEDVSLATKFITSIQSHSARLEALVADLLQLSRIESGRLDVQFCPCSLEAIVQRVLTSLEDRLQGKHLSLTCKFLKAPPVRADEKLVELVLLNLIDNAIKYTPEGGSVTLRILSKQGQVELTVTDTGVGIPSEALSRIFERFFRVDRVRSREQGGTGLGLSIVKHTMDLLGGRVWVESKLGFGAAFSISLPTWDADPGQREPRQADSGK